VPDAVQVKVVPTESEAEIACGLLRSAGIKCGYRELDVAAVGMSGWREIVVDEGDLESARELLDAPAPAE
jgi:Putative prokaryotic signal transducing protein